MDPSIAVIFALLALGAFALYFYVRVVMAKQTVSALSLPNGHEYTYVMGDYQRLYGSRGYFHGIDITLPADLPHIYLDSLKGGGHQVQFIIDPAQRIQLEGDFGKYYHVFVPKQHEDVALSILSPDVMATLQDYAAAFDVEIYGSHVRVISSRPVARRSDLQDTILYVALKIMQEIDHRLASWSDADSQAAPDEDLRIYPSRGVRVFGHYFTYWYVGWVAYWTLVCLGLLVGGIVALLDPGVPRSLGIGILVVFGLVFGLLLIMTRRKWHSTIFRSRRG